MEAKLADSRHVRIVRNRSRTLHKISNIYLLVFNKGVIYACHSRVAFFAFLARENLEIIWT